MFQFNVESSVFENAVRKIMIAIPSASKQGGGDCIQMSLYKQVGGSERSVGVLLAFNAKTEAISTMEISGVKADIDKLNVYVSGSKLMAAANAFGAIDTVLEITIDKEMSIADAESKVSLPLGEEIAKINPNEPMLIEAQMDTEKFVKFIEFASSCYQDGKGMHGMNCVGIRFDLQQKILSAASSNGTRAVYSEITDILISRAKGNQNGQEPGVDEGKIDNGKVTITVEGSILKNVVRNLSGKGKVLITTDGKRLVLKVGTYVIIILTNEQAFPFDTVVQITQKNKLGSRQNSSDEKKKEGMWKAPIDKILQALSIYEITMEQPWLEIKKRGDTSMIFQGKDELTTASVICAQQGQVSRIVLDEKQFKEAMNVFAVRYAKSKEICIGVFGEDEPLSIKADPDDTDCIIIMPIAS